MYFFISAFLYLYDYLYKYAHANDIHDTGILC